MLSGELGLLAISACISEKPAIQAKDLGGKKTEAQQTEFYGKDDEETLTTLKLQIAKFLTVGCEI